MRKYLPTLFLIALIGVGAYVYRDRVSMLVHQLYAQYSPCSQPLTYAIGSIDPRFNMSKQQFLSAIKNAETIWEQGPDRDLFTYDQKGGSTRLTTGGELTINLVYDYRQQAIDKLKGLGYNISDNQSSYDQLKAKYESLQADYKMRKAAFESHVASFQASQDAYNQQVQMWNKRGGAPRDAYQQLQNQKDALTAESVQLQQEQDSLNAEVDQINALATALNRLVGVLNLAVENYNQVGASTGGEFEEGVYERKLGEEKIDIYEFSNNAELVRVLAHELGHALGLEHVSDKNAIMYKLNQSSNDKLAVADYGELKRVCGIQERSFP